MLACAADRGKRHPSRPSLGSGPECVVLTLPAGEREGGPSQAPASLATIALSMKLELMEVCAHGWGSSCRREETLTAPSRLTRQGLYDEAEAEGTVTQAGPAVQGSISQRQHAAVHSNSTHSAVIHSPHAAWAH